MRKQWIVFLSLVVLCAASVLAATYGTVRVYVTDTDGSSIPGVTVEASSPVMIGTRTAVTDESGQAILSGLVPGTYSVRVSLDGFNEQALTARVSQNETSEVRAELTVSGMSEAITVTAEAPIVDTERAKVSDHVTLEEVEALPVSRDYRGYAQLVTGVNVVPNQGGGSTPVDPASKGGNNYRDRGGEGRTGNTGSRDNQYYLDGLIITDIASGVGSMTFNNEVILEQEVITSGVPAEYAGGKGFVGNIVTKSGGNEFSGSVNYYLQTPDMYADFDADDTRLHTALEDKYDAAFTLGGPIVRDRAWFFASGQIRESTDEVVLSTSATPTPETREYLNERTNAFGKLTFKPSASSVLIGQYFSDPQEVLGTTDVNTPPGRYSMIESTPETLMLNAQQILNNSFIIDARVGRMEWEYFQRPQYPELGALNTIVYDSDRSVPAYERLLGGSATLFEQVQKRSQADLSGTYFLEAGGSHTLKAGVEISTLEDMTNSTFANGMQFESIASEYSGITFSQARDIGIFLSDYDYIYNKLAADTTSAAFGFADANKDGVLSKDEYDNLTFTSRAGNSGGLNFFRDFIVAEGANNVKQDYNVLFLQDDWVRGDLAMNLGVRVEDIEYIASDGSTIVDMDPTFAPRLGLTYDIGGQGRQKVSAFYGRYYDPIRMDMAHFAGNISGRVLDEQIFIGNDWYTYRVRGSRERRDAGFAPNIETPYQDEIALTYGISVTPTMGFTAQVYQREERNLVEDYDPSVYFNEDAGEFRLAPEDFGYPSTGPGNVNYFLANLVGAKRETFGIDLGFEKRFAESWSAAVQYSYKDAEGNSNSDANADLQGDLLEVDPRQPYMYGRLPGTVPHQVKVFGMYRTPFNLEIGALVYWNAGAYYTEADRAYGIHIPHDRTPDNFTDSDYTRTGDEQHPSYTTVDTKFRYQLPLMRGFALDLFFDIYNLLDNQDALYREIAHNDAEFTTYGETRATLEPRRYQLGARLTF